MRVNLRQGKYVVAVSGGVDSVSLLHVLRMKPGLELAVAHFDHGIRTDSKLDCQFVEALARRHGLPFYSAEGKLGPAASEATARQARYDFLRTVRHETAARAIITAHHQDDVLETAIINVLRGTGRKGLSSLRNREDVERPLLNIPKIEIVNYATKNGLEWREDSTNVDERYLRNYVRRRLVMGLDGTSRADLLKRIDKSSAHNEEIDTLLVKYLPQNDGKLDRRRFNELPHEVALELMAAWLRARQLRDFDSRTLERLVIGGKTARPGSRLDVRHMVKLRVGKDNLALEVVER